MSDACAPEGEVFGVNVTFVFRTGALHAVSALTVILRCDPR